MQANGREQLRKHTRAFRLTEKIKLQDRLTDTKPLTDALGVPSFDELIETLLESSDALEGNVFDIIWLAKIPKYHDKGILT